MFTTNLIITAPSFVSEQLANDAEQLGASDANLECEHFFLVFHSVKLITASFGNAIVATLASLFLIIHHDHHYCQ